MRHQPDGGGKSLDMTHWSLSCLKSMKTEEKKRLTRILWPSEWPESDDEVLTMKDITPPKTHAKGPWQSLRWVVWGFREYGSESEWQHRLHCGLNQSALCREDCVHGMVWHCLHRHGLLTSIGPETTASGDIQCAPSWKAGDPRQSPAVLMCTQWALLSSFPFFCLLSFFSLSFLLSFSLQNACN